MIKLGIIGGGNMGEAIIAGAQDFCSIRVSELSVNRQQYLNRNYKVITSDTESLALLSDMIILAVKPQDIEEVLEDIKEFIGRNKIIVSIAAGITTRFLESRLGSHIKVIRAMPNMPAMSAAGMTALCRGQYSFAEDLQQAQLIFNRLGLTSIVKEDLMDKITAVSGSGPAYVFLFVDCMLKAAKALGLDEKLAERLVLTTFAGSINFLQKRNIDPEELIKMVASKGGTTEAALNVFKKKKFETIIREAVKSAAKRSQELSKKRI
jgi:pyrroline-5-carboxylate reductase